MDHVRRNAKAVLAAATIALVATLAISASAQSSIGAGNGCCSTWVTDTVYYNETSCGGSSVYQITQVEAEWTRNNTSRTAPDGATVQARAWGHNWCTGDQVDLTFSTGYQPWSGGSLDQTHDWYLSWPYVGPFFPGGSGVLGSATGAGVYYGGTFLGNSCSGPVTFPSFAVYPTYCGN
jgi:hypothetical protein